MEELMNLGVLSKAVKHWNRWAGAYAGNHCVEDAQEGELYAALNEFAIRYVALAACANLIKKEVKCSDRQSCTTEMSKRLESENEQLVEQLYAPAQELSQAITGQKLAVGNSKKLQDAIQKEEPAQFVEMLLKVLYSIRCNLFHGKKQCIAEQTCLLRPACECLKVINEANLRWLDKQYDEQLNALRI